MRVLALAILALALAWGRPALGGEMMLREPPRETFTGYGWTFLFLSVATLAYGSQALSDSKDSLDKADASYQQYLAATDPNEITNQRIATNGFLNDARADEKRANVALYLGILFGLTSYYSFFPEHGPQAPIVIGHNGIIIRHRF
jgi:hypothetical protein